VLVLGTIGALGGPRWEPDAVPGRVEAERLDTTIGSEVATEPVGSYDIAARDIEVDLGQVSVPARVTYPQDAGRQRPGIVFMHGAGTGRATSFSDQAQDLASAGVYVIVPSKRTDTYSVRHRDYVQMAQDYMASLEV